MQSNIREIREKSTVLSKIVDMDLDFQENLLSYNDDMLKIIRCNVNNFIVSTDYKNGNLTIYGKTKIYLTYISESTSYITTADFEEEFQKSISVDGGFDDVNANIRIINKYSNFRIINQRRIDIHNSFALDVKAYAATAINMVENAEQLLIKRSNVSHLSFIGSSLSRADFEENTQIPADSEVIKKIINSFWSVSVEETKIIADKMLVKAAAAFSFLYTTDTEYEVIKRCEKTFSISKIIEIDGIDENDIPLIDIDFANLYVKPKANKNNELRLIEIIGDINISASVYRNTELLLTTDCYATEKEVLNTFGKISLNAGAKLNRDIINDTAVFDFENVKIIEMLDVSLKIIDRKNIELSAFVLNENAELVFISKRQEITDVSCQMCSMFIKSFDYVIKSEQSVSVRFLIEYSAISYDEITYSILTNAEITDKVLADSPALVVYFAKEQETVWDIAKKFRTSCELIMAENELNDDILPTRRVLLIPGM